VKHRWTALVKVYTLVQNKHVGNESMLVVGIRRHPGKNPYGYPVQFFL
jgi:hypothetical protein